MPVYEKAAENALLAAGAIGLAALVVLVVLGVTVGFGI
jgi:hypothetical protein